MKLQSLGEASRQLQQIIRIYNEQRPHASLDMMTPQYAHNQSGEFKKHWKNYYFNNGNEEKKINSFISPS